MLPYFILGVALLAGFLLAGRWFATADPKTLVKFLKWLLFAVIVAVLLFFTITGRLGWALLALPALLPWFLRLRSAARMAKNFSRMASQGAGAGGGGGASDLKTEYLHMSLDHESGAMSGEVIKGSYGGRRIETLSLDELVDLLKTCWREDQPSAQVLEAYLDRVHGGWRRRAGAAGGGGGGASDFGEGAMSREEAFRVLGLEPGASQKEIKEAHHRLIAGLHPDHGGSDYLAAKINQAKDVLLGD